MAVPEKPYPVKLVTGIIFRSKGALNHAERSLVKAFGRYDFKSREIDFNFTDYYAEDMGSGLHRVFLSFQRLIDPSRLAAVKLITNRIETETASLLKAKPKRPVNIDPGYITEAKLVLASAKDYSHRIYIGKGIYAEITLCYKHKKFVPFEWTYPDYRTEEYMKIFTTIRGMFMRQRSLPK